MRWLIYILLPFSLFGQQTYVNCEGIEQQNYSVPYDPDKTYYWDITGGEIVSSTDNTITVQWPDTAGSYLVSVYTTRYGCYGDTSVLAIYVDECPHTTLFFPSSFTPNGDNINEVYQIGGKSAEEIEYISVFNRWGERIFEASSNLPWDGLNCPVGIYTINVFVRNNRYVRPITLIK